MQIGNLNKIINLFIVGFFVNALLVLFDWYFFSQYQTSRLLSFLHGFSSEAAMGLLLLIFIPVALFWGVLVEALTEMLRMEYVHTIHPEVSKKFAAVLWIKRSQLLFEAFLKWMSDELKKDPTYSADMDKIQLNERKYWTNIAAALLFRHGTREQIEYAIQHYSVYLLATNFATIVLVATLCSLIFIKIFFAKVLGAVLLMFIFYLLIRYATDKYYFAYMHIYRFAFLFAREKLNENKK